MCVLLLLFLFIKTYLVCFLSSMNRRWKRREFPRLINDKRR